MPILKMADSPVLRENPVISSGNASASGRTLPRIYKKILSRDIRQPFGGTLLGTFSLLSFFFPYLSFSTNYFSTSPGGMSKQKKSFTLLYGRLLINRAILLVWVAWVSSRRSSRTGPLTPHSCTWPSRFVDQPCAAFPAPSDTASSPSRH